MKIAFLLLSCQVLFLTACRLTPSQKTATDTTHTTAPGGIAYQADYNPGIKTARLQLKGGICNFELVSVSKKLFAATVADSSVRFILSQPQNDSTHVISFVMDSAFNKKSRMKFGGLQNVNLSLNPNPVWDITAETGAAGLNLDLSKFKIRRCNVTTGVGHCKLKLQPVFADMYVHIEAGLSSVTVSIPKDAACEVNSDSDLRNDDLEGLGEVDGKHAETANFSQSANKVHIDIALGVSSFKIKRY